MIYTTYAHAHLRLYIMVARNSDMDPRYIT